MAHPLTVETGYASVAGMTDNDRPPAGGELPRRTPTTLDTPLAWSDTRHEALRRIADGQQVRQSDRAYISLATLTLIGLICPLTPGWDSDAIFEITPEGKATLAAWDRWMGRSHEAE